MKPKKKRAIKRGAKPPLRRTARKPARKRAKRPLASSRKATSKKRAPRRTSVVSGKKAPAARRVAAKKPAKPRARTTRVATVARAEKTEHIDLLVAADSSARPLSLPPASQKIAAGEPEIKIPHPSELPYALSLPATPKSMAKRAVSALANGLKVPKILFEGDEPATFPAPEAKLEFSLLSLQRPTEPMVAPEAELPEAYGTGRLYLAARDPRCLHAHWDLTLDQQRHFISHSKHPHLSVRVIYDNPAGALACEVHVHPESRSWFLHVDRPGHTYVAELGYYQRDGHWRSIAVSEPATTPGERIVQETTLEFARVWAGPEPSPKTQDLEPPSLSRPRPAALESPAEIDIAHLAPGQYSVTPLPAVPRSEAAEAVPVSFPAELQAQAEPASQPSQTRAGPAGATVSWTSAQEEALAELLGITIVRQDWPSSAQIAEILKRPPAQAQAPAISSAEAAQLGVGEQKQGVSSPGPEWLQVSSPIGGEVPGQKSFWFNVNAELVIYGATEPDAAVSIGGRPIRLRSDGSFSYRFSLPDGSYVLPISAVAAHGDTRRAELSFQRATSYSGEVGMHPQDPALQTPDPDHVA